MKEKVIRYNTFLSLCVYCFVRSGMCEKFLFEDPKRLFGITERIVALKSYAPSENYNWSLEWRVGKQTYAGSLTGKVEAGYHWIEIIFSDEAKLYFNKNNLQQAYYPNRLCPWGKERWQEPLGGLPSVSYELVAMPFLNDVVALVKKTAKQGRKALEVDFMCGNHLHAKVFLDLKFNTILEVQLPSIDQKFKLKSLKKFDGIWGLHQAEFLKGKITTKLTVKTIKTHKLPNL